MSIKKLTILFSITFIVSFCSCKKEQKTTPPSNTDTPSRIDRTPILKLNDTFTWKRYIKNWRLGGFDSSYTLPDMQMAIKVITTDSLQFNDQPFIYTNKRLMTMSDPYYVDTTIMFRFIVPGSAQAHGSTTLTYHYKSDSIEYLHTAGGMGGGIVVRFTAKAH